MEMFRKCFQMCQASRWKRKACPISAHSLMVKDDLVCINSITLPGWGLTSPGWPLSRTNPWSPRDSAPGKWHHAWCMQFSVSPWGKKDGSSARFYCGLNAEWTQIYLQIYDPVILQLMLIPTGTRFCLLKGSVPTWWQEHFWHWFVSSF